MSGSDDDAPQLSSHALAALQEFYQEQKEKEDQLDAMKAGEAKPQLPEENWNLSQFWYSEVTADRLAAEALDAAGPHGRIVCVSCPSLYQRLIEIKPETCTAVLLEHDKRFEIYGDNFVFYDYKEPLCLPRKYEKSFDVVVADPPFLAEECLEKTSQTVKYLAKEKIMLCTGAVMVELAKQLLGVRPTSFIPRHTRDLRNEFRCFTNYTTMTLF